MPTCNVREAEENRRLKTLREAARVGIDDVSSGRFRSFQSHTALVRYIHSLAEKAIAANKRRTPR